MSYCDAVFCMTRFQLYQLLSKPSHCAFLLCQSVISTFSFYVGRDGSVELAFVLLPSVAFPAVLGHYAGVQFLEDRELLQLVQERGQLGNWFAVFVGTYTALYAVLHGPGLIICAFFLPAKSWLLIVTVLLITALLFIQYEFVVATLLVGANTGPLLRTVQGGLFLVPCASYTGVFVFLCLFSQDLDKTISLVILGDMVLATALFYLARHVTGRVPRRQITGSRGPARNPSFSSRIFV